MFILRRYDYSTKRTYLFTSYSEVVKTCVTEFNGKKAVTIFLEKQNSVKRAQIMGWIDETEEYNNNLAIEYAKLNNKSDKDKEYNTSNSKEKTVKKRKTRKKKTKE